MPVKEAASGETLSPRGSRIAPSATTTATPATTQAVTRLDSLRHTAPAHPRWMSFGGWSGDSVLGCMSGCWWGVGGAEAGVGLGVGFGGWAAVQEEGGADDGDHAEGHDGDVGDGALGGQVGGGDEPEEEGEGGADDPVADDEGEPYFAAGDLER